MQRTRSSFPALLRDRRALIGLAALVIAGVLAVVALSGGGNNAPPTTAAAKLVPADALVYVHVSTDSSRSAVRDAGRVAAKLPSWAPLRDALLRRLSATGGTGVSFDRDIKPWLGREAALALLSTPGRTAGSLIVVDVRDKAKAQAFLSRAVGARGTGTYRGTLVTNYGALATAFVGRDLVIGQTASVRSAIDLHAGTGKSLAADPTYQRAESGLRSDRVLDAYASVAGVRRLLAPQAGVLGAIGTLVDQPALLGTAMSLSAGDTTARLRVHNALDPKAVKQSAGSPFQPFTPKLVDSVPENALAYIGITGLDRAAGRLLGAGLGGTLGANAGAVLARARDALAKTSGVDLDRDVLPAFRGEVALWLQAGIPAPTLTLVGQTKNEAAMRVALAKLQAPLVKLFTPKGTKAGQAPTTSTATVDGVQVQRLKLTPAFELDYAVFDGKVVISTKLIGIAQVRRHKGSLADNPHFAATVGTRSSPVTSLLFLDLNQLLQLGEATGLLQNAQYQAVRGDLKRIVALGAHSSSGESQSTAEVTFQIP